MSEKSPNPLILKRQAGAMPRPTNPTECLKRSEKQACSVGFLKAHLAL
jgi:hypothetical protein